MTTTTTTTTTKRVAVCRKSDGVQLGTMPAAVGMVTEQGTITKVNEKSITNANGWRHEGIITVWVSEAKNHGWPKAPGCNVL